MKKFTFLVAALCATMMASATVFEKVTTAPADWSGQYLIVYENSATEAYVFNGQDAANGYVSASIADGKIESTELDNYVATIAPMTGGYSVKIAGKYYGGKSGSNSLEIGTTAVLNTLSMKADTVLLTSNTSVMRFNKAKDQKRFRYFKAKSYASQSGICLYKATTAVEDPVVEEISVSKALDLINALADGASTTAEYIVKGVVSEIITPNDTIAKYNNCDFWISDIDNPASKVEAFRTKGIDGVDFTVGLIAVGDTVKVQGTLKKFKNSKTSEVIPEINKGNLVEVVAGEGGGSEGGEEGGEVAIKDVDFMMAYYYTYDKQAYWDFDIYNYDNDYPELYIESAVATSKSSISGTYDFEEVYGTYYTSANDSVFIASGSVTITYTGKTDEFEDPIYRVAGTLVGEDGVTYTIDVQIGTEAFDYDAYFAGTTQNECYLTLEDVVAIRTVEIDNTVYARDGRIYAEEGARIYSLTGLDVTRMNGNLEGIYIVKNGNKVAKVAVAK
ncbi:MAG: hypothetical protein SPE10_00915 [Paludibacteraceae bacterium]|nr:hypothetical protein [Paludibacteraceae bacterium]